MDVGSKLDKIIESQSEFKTQQAVLDTKMSHLITDNVEYKAKMENLEIRQNKTKAIVDKHGIWFTLIHSITVFILGLIGYKNM